MSTRLRTDPRHEPTAYVERHGRVYEVLGYERTGVYTSELWLEDIGTFERLALNHSEQRDVELVQAAGKASLGGGE